MPRLLDLFCCEGGAAAGYAKAGFEVIGVDVVDRSKRYPFRFIQGDALEVLADADFVSSFDAIHASPPCQSYSITKHTHRNEHPDLVGPTREALEATGKPWVLENVVGAPLVDPVTLCGTMFALSTVDDDGTPLFLKRHRLFESNLPLHAPDRCWCATLKRDGWRCAGAYGGGSRDKDHARYVRRGGYTPSKQKQGELLGIDWMTLHGLAQSIPPAYTENLGRQLIEGAGIGAQLALF